MLITTQIKIGEIIYNDLETSKKRLISNRSFHFGLLSLHADESYENMIDKFDYTYAIFKRHYDEVTTKNLSTHEFSRKLGLLVHLVCLYSNSIITTPLYKHENEITITEYLLKMDDYLNRKFNRKRMIYKLEENCIDKDVLSYLYFYIKKYVIGTKDYKSNIELSFQVSEILIHDILSKREELLQPDF
jgi:hypothetical protein